jgi:hypothetical protein
MEISHAGKKEPRMFTDGERPQPVVESAPRHTSRLIAAQCLECRIRNPPPLCSARRRGHHLRFTVGDRQDRRMRRHDSNPPDFGGTNEVIASALAFVALAVALAAVSVIVEVAWLRRQSLI